MKNTTLLFVLFSFSTMGLMILGIAHFSPKYRGKDTPKEGVKGVWEVNNGVGVAAVNEIGEEGSNEWGVFVKDIKGTKWLYRCEVNSVSEDFGLKCVNENGGIKTEVFFEFKEDLMMDVRWEGETGRTADQTWRWIKDPPPFIE